MFLYFGVVAIILSPLLFAGFYIYATISNKYFHWQVKQIHKAEKENEVKKEEYSYDRKEEFLKYQARTIKR